MDFKLGDNELLYIYDSGTYYPIGCVTGQGFSESANMLDTTTRKNTSGWTTSIPTTQSYDIRANAVVTTTDISGTVMTYEDIMTLKRAKTKIGWKINSEVTGYSDFGEAYISSISRVAEMDSFIVFSIELVGWGQPVRALDSAQFLTYTLTTPI